MPTAEQTAGDAGAPLTRVPSGGLVLGAIASVQFGAAIAATLFQRIGPAGTVFLRLAFGSLILTLVWRPRLGGRARRDLALAVVFGLVLASMNLSFYEALHRVPLGIAVALEFVGPLAVAVAGSRHRLDVLWIGLALAGILALTHPGSHALNGLGVVLALLAGCFWGIYILLNARLGSRFEGGSGLTLAMWAGTLAVLPAGVIAGGGSLLSGEALALGAVVGLLSSAIPYSFEVEALRRIAPHVFGVLMSLEPAMGALAGLLVLGQRLAVLELLGVALVVVASVGASRSTREEPVAL